MHHEYVKLVESCLSEQQICKTSEIYRKFIKLVQGYFIPKAKNGELILIQSNEEPLRTDDIEIFCKHKLIAKQDNKIRLTKKGMMLATGKEIDSCYEPTEDEFKNHIEQVKDEVKNMSPKEKELNSQYGYVLTVYANGSSKSSHEDEWHKEMKRKKQLQRVAKKTSEPNEEKYKVYDRSRETAS